MEHKITTRHSLERAKERMGCNAKKAVRMIRLALERGKCAEDFTSMEREFLERHSADDYNAIAYNDFCYIFDKLGACLTMYQLPSWFCKKKNFNGKERIRNPKAYSRNYNLI